MLNVHSQRSSTQQDFHAVDNDRLPNTDHARDDEYILYTKEYTCSEQAAQDGGHGFHPGFSLRSLFETFTELQLAKGSVEEFSAFLDSDTIHVLRAAEA